MDVNLHLLIICSALVLLLTGWAWLLVNAFRRHVLWGVGGLIVPLVLIVHGLLDLRANRTALLAYVAGLVVLGVALAQPIEVRLPAAPDAY